MVIKGGVWVTSTPVKKYQQNWQRKNKKWVKIKRKKWTDMKKMETLNLQAMVYFWGEID